MPRFLNGLRTDWNAATASGKLAIISDAASLVGFSLTAMLGAVAVEMFRPGKVDWVEAILALSGVTFFLAGAIAVHALLVWMTTEMGLTGGVAKWVVRLALASYWLFLVATMLLLGPQIVRSVLRTQ